MTNDGESKTRVGVFVQSWRTGCLTLVMLIFGTCAAMGQTVLARARIGNNIAGMTFVGNGPLEDSIAFVDGHQLRAVSAGEGDGPRTRVRELLDLKMLPINAFVQGIAYVSAEKTFLLWDNDPNSWFVLDGNARPLAAKHTVTHLPALGVAGGDGMVYLPPSAKRFGDRIVAIVFDDSSITHIEVIKRNGQAVAEIIPKGALDPSLEAITGIGFRAPDQLLIGTSDNFLWAMDFDGNVVQGPVDVSPSSDFEGLAQTSDGNIVAASYADGNLFFFDRNFKRLPRLDRDVRIGIGKSTPHAVAWDSDTQSVLVDPALHAFGTTAVAEIDALPVSLDSFVEIADLPGIAATGLTYLAGEQRIGVCRSIRRSIRLYDNNGTLTEEVDIQNPSTGNLGEVTFVPTRQQFAFRLGPGSATNTMIHFAKRTGEFVRDVDLSPLGILGHSGIAFFPAGPGDPNPDGNLVVNDLATQRVVFIDVDATTVLGQMDYRSPTTLNLVNLHLGYISNGPLAGSFMGLDFLNSEIVIFRR